jgi:FKBP-type peptidyl-prolyl cis-trans isomerase FkpA
MNASRRWFPRLTVPRILAVLCVVALAAPAWAEDKPAKPASAVEQEKAKGKEFLAKAAKEKGAERTASGLVYVPLKSGTGASPKATDTVRVHYRGTFIDGKEFDASLTDPVEFPLNRVVPCWTEGVQKIKVGGKAKLVCPSEIAYGDRGAGGLIPGGATLVFEVELLGIVGK